MAFTETAKQLIPSWLDETQLENLYQQLAPTGQLLRLTKDAFSSLVKDSENWKRESKQKIDGNLQRVLDCRPLNNCLKLQVITDANEQVIRHSFQVSTSGAGLVPIVPKSKPKKKVYLFVIGRHSDAEMADSGEGLSPYYVCICSKNYWEKNHCTQDGFSESESEKMEGLLEELDLFELSECTYEPGDPEITLEQLRENLLAAGFEEDPDFTKFMASAGNPDMDPDSIQMYAEAGASNNPSDYYFRVESTPDSLLGPIMISICPKKHFDAEGYLFDQHLTQDNGGPLQLDPRFEELQEAIFGFDGAATEAEDLLKKMGMTLNPQLPKVGS